jgi:hypothetical protein
MVDEVRYTVCVRVRGTLDPDWWSSLIDGVVVREGADDTSLLVAELPDQAGVHGFLAAIRDLGLALVSIQTESATPRSEGVERLPRRQPQAQARPRPTRARPSTPPSSGGRSSAPRSACWPT